MKNLEEKFKNMHLLDREERIKLKRELKYLKPEFIKPFVPRWWWWRRCQVNVLIVCDGGLNYGMGGFGLSEFLTTFNKLEATTNVDYKVTLAHRGTVSQSNNNVVVNHIANFTFDRSTNLTSFDQIWLFGINSGGNISIAEKNAIESYMDGGGGLFATGDHGSLGYAMCGEIPRVKDMRYWKDSAEVSMGGNRRNDTNRPAAGDTTSKWFDNQSDDIPQTIGVRTFGNGMPHSLLSISTGQRSSGIIDIMPDHPHEGECKPETTFTVNGMSISSQIIATSFVLGGSTTFAGAGKALTEPHCFPSISVWDGRQANVGRIVVDSTWHHFININLDGSGSGIDNGAQSGLSNSDFNVIRQYYMNIATWMTRRKPFWLCWRRLMVFELLVDSQLIEASLDNPTQRREEIQLSDLNSIGALAEEILASKFNPAFARNFLLEIMNDYNEEFSKLLEIWEPEKKEKNKEEKNEYYKDWLNLDLILWSSIGAGFIELRDNKKINSEMNEKALDKIFDVFIKGVDFGFKSSIKNLNSNYKMITQTLKDNRSKK